MFQPDAVINPGPPPTTFTGTYNVFFAYAKPTTRQTYLIYLGPNATAADIKAIQVRLDTLNNQPDFPTTQPWLTTDTTQIATSGIISVTVDFTKLTDGTLDLTSNNGLCQPRTFCTWNDTNKTCGSALDSNDPNFSQSVAVCKEWAVKDLDCPPAGCYGFSFTIPKTGFTADATLTNPSPHRPAPVAFPSTATIPTEQARHADLARQVPPDDEIAGCDERLVPLHNIAVLSADRHGRMHRPRLGPAMSPEAASGPSGCG